MVLKPVTGGCMHGFKLGKLSVLQAHVKKHRGSVHRWVLQPFIR